MAVFGPVMTAAAFSTGHRGKAEVYGEGTGPQGIGYVRLNLLPKSTPRGLVTLITSEGFVTDIHRSFGVRGIEIWRHQEANFEHRNARAYEITDALSLAGDRHRKPKCATAGRTSSRPRTAGTAPSAGIYAIIWVGHAGFTERPR